MEWEESIMLVDKFDLGTLTFQTISYIFKLDLNSKTTKLN